MNNLCHPARTIGRKVRGNSRRVGRSAGFTIIEIILALSILAGGLAITSEMTRIAQQNARVARDLTYAQMLGETKMNEIASGVAPIDSEGGVAFGAPYDGWSYSVESADAEVAGLHTVTVTVYQDPAPKVWPVNYSLVRWVGDPAAPVSSPDSSSASSSSQNSSSSSGNSSNSSSSGNSSQSGSTGGASK